MYECFFNLCIKECNSIHNSIEREVCQSMKIEQCFIGPIRFRSTIEQYDSVVGLSVSTHHNMCNVSRDVFFILFKRIRLQFMSMEKENRKIMGTEHGVQKRVSERVCMCVWTNE